MTAQIVAGCFLILSTLLTHFVAWRPNQLHRDAELLSHLPEGSTARKVVLQSIEDRADGFGKPSWLHRTVTSSRTHTVLYIGLIVLLAGFYAYWVLQADQEQQRAVAVAEEQLETAKAAMREAAERQLQTQRELELLRQEIADSYAAALDGADGANASPGGPPP